MGKSPHVQRKKTKTKRRNYPLFINSARWRKSETYFKENYHPQDLYDFDWDYWETYISSDEDHMPLQSIRLPLQNKTSHKDTRIEVPDDVQNQNQNSEQANLDAARAIYSAPSLQAKSFPQLHQTRYSRSKKDVKGQGDCLSASNSGELRHFALKKRMLLGLEPFVQTIQRIYRSFVRSLRQEAAVSNADEEYGHPRE